MTAGQASPVFDFSSLDFAGVEPDLTTFAQARFPDEQWTDFNDSNFATGLVQLMAYATDLLSYNGNAQALETIVTTLVREQNFRNIAKTLDYTLDSASPSACTERFTLDPGGTYPFTISSHVQVTANDGTIFQPTADTAVASYPFIGYVEVAIVQGEESFQENIGTTTGQPGQRFTLGNTFMIDDTLSVSIGSDSYELVPNAIVAGPTEKTYTIETDENGVTTVIVGDSINGIIPPKGQTVLATYKTGGGLNTNFPINTIVNLSGTSDGSSLPTQILSVTNTTAAEGGGPRESIESAKKTLPLSLKANERCVTLQDFSTEAVKIDGVFKAKAVDGKPYGGATPVLIFVVPDGGPSLPLPAAPISDALRNNVIVGLKDKKLAGKRIQVLDPVYAQIFIEQDLFVLPNSPALVVGNRMQTALQAKYGLDAMDFGILLGLQDAYDSVAPTVIIGESRVFYKRFTILPYFARHVTVPTTGNGGAVNIVVNASVKRREWLIQILPPIPGGGIFCKRFQIFQRQLGVVTSVTDTLVTDEKASYESNILATEGWVFHPNPEINSTVFSVTGNTDTTITVAGGLLAFVSPDDPYVVEKFELAVGKVLRTTLTAPAAATTILTVDDSTSFLAGDPVRVWLGETFFRTQVVSVPDGVTIEVEDPITIATAANVDYVWVSDDESVEFTVEDGTTAFITGDSFYVDTYAAAGDIQLRDEVFPLLDNANLVINAIGGVR